MIEIDRLNFRYPRSDFCLNLPSLKIDDGERVAVVGPSGCGKTTFLNLLSGIEIGYEGSVQVDGKQVSSMTDDQRRNFRIANIGMVFQQFELIDYLNVEDNILLPFAINASLKTESPAKQNATELARAMGIEKLLKRRPARLSQGEQQRVAICRALVAEPKIILADEPTGNLDPKNKRVILDLIFEQAKRANQTLVVVTHDLNIVDRFDRTLDFETFFLAANQPRGSQGDAFV